MLLGGSSIHPFVKLSIWSRTVSDKDLEILYME